MDGKTPTDNDFVSELTELMREAEIVNHASNYLDCCGRESRTHNVVKLPASLLGRFKKFTKSRAYSEAVLADGKPHGMVKAAWGKGNFHLSGRSRDYDGITLEDSAAINIRCAEYVSFTAAVYVAGEIPRYNWLKGIVKEKGIEVHPVSEVRGVSKCTSGGQWFPIDYPWGMCDSTYVCFV